MRTIKLSAIIVVLIFCHLVSYSQYNRNSPQNKYGGSAIFNMSNKSLGLGFRAEFPIQQIDLLEGLSIVPQVSYFPEFNSIHEFYIGSGIHLNAYSYEKLMFYGLMNLSYNGWINNEDTENRIGNFSNMGFEIGGGLSYPLFKCLHPFLELRFNFKWIDPMIQLGIMHNIRCNKRGAVPCSKVPPQPSF